MDKKYYWMCYWVGMVNHKKMTVTSRHPFEYIKLLNYHSKLNNHVLMNWKEITEEEYKMFNS